MHVASTGEITNFHVLPDIQYDTLNDTYLLVGLVGVDITQTNIHDLNKIYI